MRFMPLQEILGCSAGKGPEGAKETLVVTRTTLGQRSGERGEGFLQALSPLPVPWGVAGLVPGVR